MDETIHKLAILFADVSKSTHIYEKYGDKVARTNINHCLDILSDITNSHNGKVIKTIGDEVMCRFVNPVKAALAAQQMHRDLREASDEGEFSIGTIRVKIGWHYGPVERRGIEVIGEAPVTAQQMIRLAKPEEILTSKQSLSMLPDELKREARFIDSIEAEAYNGKVEVYALPWEEDESEVTRIGKPSPSYDDEVRHKALVLDYPGKSIQVDSMHTHCRIGRGKDCDLCVPGKFTSRQHAEIVFSHGIFHLRDQSTNGTGIIFSDGRKVHLHREEAVLTEKGIIFFGGLPEQDPGAAVQFHCERID